VGAAWSATPLRITRSVAAASSTSETRTKLEVVHDGLFVHVALATGIREAVVLADRAHGQGMRMKASPVSALFGTLPAAPVSGDSAFDQSLIALTDDAGRLAGLSLDLRRALVTVVDLVGGPLRIGVGRDGIGLAFPGRGRFRELSASEEMASPFSRKASAAVVAEMTDRFTADAELLSRIPDAAGVLGRAAASGRVPA
jgi:hypothetical protein